MSLAQTYLDHRSQCVFHKHLNSTRTFMGEKIVTNVYIKDEKMPYRIRHFPPENTGSHIGRGLVFGHFTGRGIV